MSDGPLGRISVAKHRIKLLDENTQTIHLALYWAGPKTREFEKVNIENMLRDNIIEHTQTKWAAPIVFALMKDGSLRFSVDYRRLNAANKRDLYPIPRKDECIDSLAEAAIFSTLNANSA